MLIVVADRDASFRLHIERLLEGSELVPLSVAEPASVVEELRDRRSAIVLLGIRGAVLAADELHVLEALREMQRHTVLALLEPGADDLVLASVLAAGADDVLVKPVSSEILWRRLRVSLHRARGGDRLVGAPRGVLREALDARATGRMVMRGKRSAGSVELHDGHVVWASGGDDAAQLRALLSLAQVPVDQDTIEAVLDEARRTASHLAEVLASWGYLAGDDGRELVRQQLTEALARPLADAQASALFVPASDDRDWPWRFELDELVPAQQTHVSQLAPALSLPPRAHTEGPALSESETSAMVERAAELGGAVCVSLLDRTTGMVLQHVGPVAMDPALSWSMLATLRALGPGARETIAETEQHAHIARVVHAEVVLIVSFSLRAVSLGLARASLSIFEHAA